MACSFKDANLDFDFNKPVARGFLYMYASIGTMLLILVVPATFPGLLCMQATALCLLSLWS